MKGAARPNAKLITKLIPLARPRQTRLGLLPCIAYPPQGFRAVVGHHERTILRHGYANGTSPNLSISGDKARQKILILSPGAAVVYRNIDHFIACANAAVPGSVLSREYISVILGRKLLALVEGQFQ